MRGMAGDLREFLKGGFHQRKVNLVHLEAGADPARISDAELAAEVLLEIAQAAEDRPPPCRRAQVELRKPELEPAPLQPGANLRAARRR